MWERVGKKGQKEYLGRRRMIAAQKKEGKRRG
jgi:hypothetical protein